MFTTGDSLSGATAIYRLVFPVAEWWLYNINAALAELTFAHNWTQGGSVSIEDAIEAANDLCLTFQPGGLMLGLIIPYMGKIEALPSQYLLCDGGTYEATDYPALYAVIDDSWKVGLSQFTVPDLANRVVMGASITRPIGTEVGSETHTLTIGEMPTHSHSYVPPTANVDLETPGAPDLLAAGVGLPANTGDSGGGGAHNNIQPSTTLYYVVVAQ